MEHMIKHGIKRDSEKRSIEGSLHPVTEERQLWADTVFTRDTHLQEADRKIEQVCINFPPTFDGKTAGSFSNIYGPCRWMLGVHIEYITEHEELKFFIAKKIAEDAAWQVPDIIFSGHEVPGACVCVLIAQVKPG